MTLVLVTPASPSVTLAEAKVHLRIDDGDDDALVSALISAAVAHAERWTGIALEEAVWSLSLDGFPSGGIGIPLAPVISVDAVAYLDAEGATQSFADFYVAGQRVYPSSTWPATQARAGAVTVEFTAGAGTPADVRAAILLMIGHWYERREAASEKGMTEIPMGAYALLNLHRQLFV